MAVVPALRTFITGRVRAESPVVARVQQAFRCAALDVLAHGLSVLGAELWYIVVILALVLCYAPVLGLSFGILLAFSLYLGNVLKNALHLPRPGPPVVALERNHDWGFPSTHALCAVTLPFFLLVRFAPALSAAQLFVASAGCTLYALSIMASRIYLGVHSFVDVAGGVLFGVPVLGAFLWLERYLWEALSAHPAVCLLLVALAALLAYVHPEPYPTSSFYVSALMMGTAAGGFVEIALFHNSVLSRIPVLASFGSLRERIAVGLVRFVLVGVTVAIIKELTKLALNTVLPPLLQWVGFTPRLRLCAHIESLPTFSHDRQLEGLLANEPGSSPEVLALVRLHMEQRSAPKRTISPPLPSSPAERRAHKRARRAAAAAAAAATAVAATVPPSSSSIVAVAPHTPNSGNQTTAERQSPHHHHRRQRDTDKPTQLGAANAVSLLAPVAAATDQRAAARTFDVDVIVKFVSYFVVVRTGIWTYEALHSWGVLS